MPFLPRAFRAAVLVPLAIAAVALTGVTPASADNTVPPPVSGDVLYWWTNTGNDGTGVKCMQIDPGRDDDFAPVDQYHCQYRNNQGWRMGSVNGDPTVFWLQNVASGKCLDDYAYGTNQGNPIIQYTCLIGTNQQWRMIWNYNDGSAQFQNVNSGLCLSVDAINSSNYRRFVQNPCYGFINERFDAIWAG
ncbi:RICIN domain-containing protein [Kutzneria sp. 744]|uniref:RICIN domain-containing protein n=1 Tax=Kutzneria sp. (strain 744) TaxID=345341 RepID=UPI0003EEDFC0|nr:RICIN domain-containing protein [Kutzneria sp. 744]EWM19573.1 ricin-type beta-trefoil lectin domain-containing protein [Kutzneria sp. 744]